MADIVGVALAVPAVVAQVWKLYEKCRDSSTNFRHLGQDLKNFYNALVLTQHYLVHLDDVRKGCDEAADHIQKTLSRFTDGNRVERAIVTLEDLHPLRSQLNYQISILSLYILMLHGRGSCQGGAHPTPPLLSNVHAGGVPQRVPQPTVLTDSVSSTSSLGVFSDASSPLHSTDSLTSIDTTTGCSNKSSTVVSTQLVEDAIENTITVAFNVLIAISKMPQHLPEHSEQVKMLIRQGASFERTDKVSLRTPLIWAVISGRKELVELYLQEGANKETRDGLLDWTPVMFAVMWERTDILLTLIRHEANIEATEYKTNRTALLWAADFGNHRAVEIILDNKKEIINARDKDGMSPLGLAYSKGFREIVKICVEAGDDTNFKLASGYSLLESAILARDEEFARLLLGHGADAQTVTVGGIPVLALTIRWYLPEIAQLLVEKGADVQSADESGDCPLILAIQRNLLSLAKLLVEMGADVQRADKNGVPALILAVKDQRHEIARILLQHEANVEAVDPDGYCALLWAVSRGDAILVKMLLEKGAYMGAPDGQRGTVKDWAASSGNTEIVKLVRPTDYT